ncbi:derlin-2/3 [Cryptococcus gattii E566]|uniref:Derlin n=2 Tax=Cryptococcus gattii TaxID=37769 RepID=E6RCE5_CRYGW|nr:uncharacterized protein CGB_I3690W [Cryptococcus gattii WM276]ADV24433.1 hypothetical protein CNBJ0680 [Cryptococcus gattii WM276]KIR76289.1 derlin-2/3 [Cryptococcus gattii EJB2]KIY32580.1 derlin-2/3 [Cryptococcus gattii E566]KJE02387.1 derlin-2/3 [Cryptococcus gattii NT-10]
MADFSAAFSSVPPVTRTILIGLAVVTFPCLLGLTSPASVALLWRRVTHGYEIWRLLTCFFFGGGGFPLLYDFFLIYRNSSSMETDTYHANTAEYAWLHVMMATFILIFNMFIGLPFLFRPLLHAQTYVWCRVNPTVKVSIFGLLTIPTSLYPVALIVLDLLTGGPPKAIGGVMGLLAGHLWWFLSTYVPLYAPSHLRHKNPLATPRFFKSWFLNNNTNRRTFQTAGTSMQAQTSFATSSSRSEAAQEARHRWGGGQQLGGSTL